MTVLLKLLNYEYDYFKKALISFILNFADLKKGALYFYGSVMKKNVIFTLNLTKM